MADNNTKDIEKEAKGTGNQEPNDGGQNLPATQDDAKKGGIIEWAKDKKQKVDDWKEDHPKIMKWVHRAEGGVAIFGLLAAAALKTKADMENDQETNDYESDDYNNNDDDDDIIDMPEKK